ncbi:MAG: MBL fold metallo-hydrolase [Saprospiraceae bacterium]
MNIVHSSENVSVFQSVLFKTNASILQVNDSVIVVDPNWLPGEVEFLAGQVIKKMKKSHIYLFFTHSDYDHIIGYRAFPEAKVIASKAFNENPHKQNVLNQILKFDHDYYLDRMYSIDYPSVDLILEDEKEVCN